MYEAHQVRSKSRFAVRRREEDVEEEEIQSGEINLIPYLDIVTNLMLFLLASVSAGILLGQLNTMLPDRAFYSKVGKADLEEVKKHIEGGEPVKRLCGMIRRGAAMRQPVSS